MQDLWIKQGRGFILVYAINSFESLSDLRTIYAKIQRIKNNSPISITVVGNKMDLESERKVKFQEGKDFADSIQANFLETSAKTNKNCVQVFEELVRQIRTVDQPVKQEVKKKKSFFKEYCTLI